MDNTDSTSLFFKEKAIESVKYKIRKIQEKIQWLVNMSTNRLFLSPDNLKKILDRYVILISIRRDVKVLEGIMNKPSVQEVDLKQTCQQTHIFEMVIERIFDNWEDYPDYRTTDLKDDTEWTDKQKLLCLEQITTKLKEFTISEVNTMVQILANRPEFENDIEQLKFASSHLHEITEQIADILPDSARDDWDDNELDKDFTEKAPQLLQEATEELLQEMQDINEWLAGYEAFLANANTPRATRAPYQGANLALINRIQVQHLLT